MADEVCGFSRDNSRRIVDAVRRVENTPRCPVPVAPPPRARSQRIIEGYLAGKLDSPTLGQSTTATLNVFSAAEGLWTFWIDAGASGTWTLTYGTTTSDAISATCTAAQLQTAFEALSVTGAGTTEVIGGPFPDYPIGLRGYCVNPDDVTVDSSGLSGGSVHVSNSYGYTNESYTITNRDQGFSRIKGDYLQAVRMGSEWRPIESGIRFVEGVLYSDLTESTGSGTSPSSATLHVYTGSGVGWAYGGQSVTVTNRDDTYYAPAGTYIVAMQINGEWRPIPTMAPTDEAIWGTLTGSLSSGGSQTINVYHWSGSAWVATSTFVTVYEVMGLSSPLPAGTKIWAQWHAQSARYCAIVKPGC